MTEPLPDDQRLRDLSSKAYEHPADRAATAALQSIPMLDQVGCPLFAPIDAAEARRRPRRPSALARWPDG